MVADVGLFGDYASYYYVLILKSYKRLIYNF